MCKVRNDVEDHNNDNSNNFTMLKICSLILNSDSSFNVGWMLKKNGLYIYFMFQVKVVVIGQMSEPG